MNVVLFDYIRCWIKLPIFCGGISEHKFLFSTNTRHQLNFTRFDLKTNKGIEYVTATNLLGLYLIYMVVGRRSSKYYSLHVPVQLAFNLNNSNELLFLEQQIDILIKIGWIHT